MIVERISQEYQREYNRFINLALACENNGFADRAKEYRRKAENVKNEWQNFLNNPHEYEGGQY